MISHYQLPVTVSQKKVFKSIPIDPNLTGVLYVIFADIRIKWSCFLYSIVENPAHIQEKQFPCWIKSSFVVLYASSQ